ncbi:methyl-accepting chemotaxis protein [Breznakiella homolactica]|uniref:HAMP domain-containing protein n=1 Tax=Breznakiella homolactica TaxID=2798577 RepID=A0A7T8BBX2_9SPIR|nr:methyl-accepting chemotaxis protein [Breznakiella homolactica]QQO09648.1 HAMP domain-containing protein [Breznakiella homolactica]
MKLSQKIILYIVIIILFISLGIGITSLVISYNVIQSTADQSLMKQAESGKKLLDVTISSQLTILEEVVSQPEVKTMDWEIQREALRNDVERLGYIDFGVIVPDGTVRYVLGDEVSNLGERDYVQRAFKGISNVSDVLISKVINAPVVMFAVPIFNNDTVVGVLVARRGGNALSDITNTMGFGETGYAYLINGAGVIISHKDRDLVMNQFSPLEAVKEDTSYRSIADAFGEIIRTRQGLISYNFNDSNVVAGYVPVDSMDWIFVVTIENSELMAGINTLFLFVTLGTAGFLIVGIISALVIGRSISRPLSRMLPVLETVSEGNLTEKIAVSTKDELGIMADTFNRSISGLAQMVATTKESAGKLDSMAGDLSTRMNETVASMEEITVNIANVKEHARNQSESVSETNRTMEEIKEYADKLNSLIGSQSAAIVESSAAIEEMVANIKSVTEILQKSALSMKELLDASEVGRAELQEVTGIIRTIEGDSEGLIEASNIIQNIAQQTNLLSMNAAIEAAHAGETGKGFAVVAGEIRKLAENSSAQGKNITNVLGSLKQKINSAVGVSDKAQMQFDQILSLVSQVQGNEEVIKNAMEEQTTGSGQILDAMKEINDITTQVRDGSVRMISGSSTVLDEMGKVINITKEVDTAMDEMSGSVDHINSAVQDASIVTEETKANVATLSGAVDKFTV